MNSILKSALTASVLILSTASYTTQAGLITDAVDNNTLVNAQDLNGAFSSTAYGPGFEVIPPSLDWVSISASGTDVDAGMNGFNDYFSFTVDAGAVAFFDFDNAVFNNGVNGAKSELFDAMGSGIAYDSNGWDAPTTGFVITSGDMDSNILSYNFASAGTYTFGLTGTCDFGCGPTSVGDSYTLNIAVAGLSPVSPGSSVPEPSTLAIFSFALFGFGVRKYKARK